MSHCLNFEFGLKKCSTLLHTAAQHHSECTCLWARKEMAFDLIARHAPSVPQPHLVGKLGAARRIASPAGQFVLLPKVYGEGQYFVDRLVGTGEVDGDIFTSQFDTFR